MIQWFPGHMQKARRQMEEQLKLVDVVIELRDARIPYASENPLLKEMTSNKPRILILNKADLADNKMNEYWSNILSNCLVLDSTNSNIKKSVVEEIKRVLSNKIEKARDRGIRNKTLRAMVVGIPNIGKSTFINTLAHRRVAKVENKPGVTKTVQWIKLDNDIELLDTPGVLWPKIDNQTDAMLLALTGSINNDVIDNKYEVVSFALEYLKENYPGLIENRYGVKENSNSLIEDIAVNKKWVLKGNEIDVNKAIDNILSDIRLAKIGKVTWQKC